MIEPMHAKVHHTGKTKEGTKGKIWDYGGHRKTKS